MDVAGYIVLEPGSLAAREEGCTCPVQTAAELAGGGKRYAIAPACPIHQLAAELAAATAAAASDEEAQA